MCELGFLSVFELFDVNKHSSKVVHRVLLSLILTLECHFFSQEKTLRNESETVKKKLAPNVLDMLFYWVASSAGQKGCNKNKVR